jgi:pimeloyl-ACP methyl ester carboxylesterase
MTIRKTTARALRWPLISLAAAMASLVGAALVVVPTVASAQAGPEGQLQPGPVGPKPTIVLVHGAFADASSWDNVIAILQHEGYAVDAPPDPLRGLNIDSAYLTSYLSTISGPIVLVGHSYGGAVITNAAYGNANVRALVYVDAFEPAQGETLEQLTFSRPGSCLTGGGNLNNVFNFVVDPSQPAGNYDLYLKIAPGADYAGFDTCFATDVPPTEAAILGTVQRPLALDAFTAPSGPPAWASIPSWAVIGTQDRAIPPAELTFMAQRAHSQVTYVTAGHLSMITQPGVVAKVINEAVFATK